MTNREARKRISALSTERDGLKRRNRQLMGQIAGARPRRVAGWCVYCGIKCTGKACAEHRDLVQIDPGMGAAA